MVLGKNIAHDMKSGAEGAHFFGALLLTFSFDKHKHGQKSTLLSNNLTTSCIIKIIYDFPNTFQDKNEIADFFRDFSASPIPRGL